MIYKLTGSLQNYVWGGHQYIPQLLNIPAEENQYYAEWWLGAHHSAPSTIEVDGKNVLLTEFLQKIHPHLAHKAEQVLVMNYRIY